MISRRIVVPAIITVPFATPITLSASATTGSSIVPTAEKHVITRLRTKFRPRDFSGASIESEDRLPERRNEFPESGRSGGCFSVSPPVVSIFLAGIVLVPAASEVAMVEPAPNR